MIGKIAVKEVGIYTFSPVARSDLEAVSSRLKIDRTLEIYHCHIPSPN